MDIILLMIGIIFIILGLTGCFLPFLPGPHLNYAALVILHFTKYTDFNSAIFIYLGILTLIVQIIDYVVPVWGTKKFGGSNAETRGIMPGLIAGLFFLPAIGPFGIITIFGGPFIGGFPGEKIACNGSDKAMRAAFGSFVGFLGGTFMKLACAGLISFYFISALIH
jgi:uncharacterized protein